MLRPPPGKAPARRKQKPDGLRQRQKQFTRALLVDAARALFAEKGYNATTIDDLLSAAQIGSRSTFYLHFENKTELMAVLWDEAVEIVSPNSRARELDAAVVTGTREAIRAWVEAAFASWDLIRHLLPAMTEALTLEPPFAERMSQGFISFSAEMTAYLARFPKSEQAVARARVEALLIGLDRVYYRWSLRGGKKQERTIAIDALTDIFYATLTVGR